LISSLSRSRYAISGERTLQAFYEALSPFASPFMALFGRDQMPSRSALSRWLAALTPPVIEALRTLFLKDGLARPLCKDAQEAGLLDRQGQRWIVFDVDGTREAARQRALPHSDDLPEPKRRLDRVCAPGYTGRKRGEVVRTRTTVSQAHSYHWLGSFGNKGNGRYRDELRQAKEAINSYLVAQQFPHERLCSAWMANMAQERYSPIWRAFPLSRVARTTPCWIGLRSRPACTCLPISPFPAQKARWCVSSTTARTLLWDRLECAAAWWWRLIRKARPGVALASPARESSTNCS